MGQIRPHPPVIPILAAFSRYDSALAWAEARAGQFWGPTALASPRFNFAETDYYEPTMGPGLRKCFWSFQRPADPRELAEWKIQTNQWEEDYARSAGFAEPRPLNLDPGYLTPAKLVLASTKDHAHRIYLAEGIFAEVTLYFRDGRWQAREWTFPDYRRTDYQEFFTAVRNLIKSRRAREEE